MLRENSIVFDILAIFGGLAILLLGMRLVNNFISDEVASFIDIIPMLFALWFISNMLHVERFIGKNGLIIFLLIIASLTFILLIFSVKFVFSPTGYYYTLENTGILNEHAWCHDCIKEISEHSFFDIFQGGIEYMNLGKYESLFVYCSLMFRFGGDVLTHICIWRAFHLGLVTILMILIAEKIGVKNRKRFVLIMMICLFMPMLHVLFAYNHDGVGYAFVALGTYLFISCSSNVTKSLVVLPFFVLLFYWYRPPYALIAVAMYLWNAFSESRNKNKIVALLAVVLLALIFFATVDIGALLTDKMGMEVYSDAFDQNHKQRNFFNALAVTITGYFPWTNLFHDVIWPYNFFCCFQGAMNITLLYYIYYSYKRNFFKSMISNPVLLIGCFFLLGAMVYPGFANYTSVAMTFFAVVITNVDVKRFFKSYSMSIVIIFFLGLLWDCIR